MFTCVFAFNKTNDKIHHIGERKEFTEIRHACVSEMGKWNIFYTNGNIEKTTLDVIDWELIQVYAPFQ